jgi:hypothetical protein
MDHEIATEEKRIAIEQEQFLRGVMLYGRHEGQRVFVTNDDGEIQRISYAKFTRMHQEGSFDALPKYSGTIQRVAIGCIILKEAEPTYPEYWSWVFPLVKFTSTGQIDLAWLAELKKSDGVKGKDFQWTPTEQEKQLLVAAVFGIGGA